MSATRSAVVLAGILWAGVAAGAAVVDPAALRGDVAADTAVIQHAIDACAAAGGGTVVVPSAVRATVGSLRLRSHVDLHLERGAVLRASGNKADFSITNPYPVVTRPDEVPPPMPVMIFADEAEDVAISGAGTIDGNGDAYVESRGVEIHRAKSIRPYTVVFRSCRRVTLRDVTIREGAFWTVRTLGCDDVLIADIRIENSLLMPNNDGLDVDWSSNVRIRGCHIVSGDDCIALKTAPVSTGVDRPCENIVISGCTLMSRSSAIVLGSDVVGTIRNVLVTDCAIRDSHRGVSVRVNLAGTIERAVFSNLVIETRLYDPAWWGRGTPIDVVVTPWNEVTTPGHVRDIVFNHILCRGENGIVVYGHAPGLVERITFENVDVTIDKATAYEGGRQDLRPAPGDAFPLMPTAGFLLRRASGVILHDCTVRWGEHRPEYYQSALDAEGCVGLEVWDFAGESARPDTVPARRIR